ncbi:MAG: response regulator, partial [Myxococcota bacterium]
ADDKKTILVVDDDQDVLDNLRVVLEANGYQMAEAGSGEEGLRVYKQKEPDLLLVDLMMETIDAGTAFVKELKAQGCTAPIYMHSSVGDMLNLEVDPSELGVSGTFQKPVNPEKLLSVLKQSPAGALTSTLDESGRQWLADSGALSISGSVPQPTTVTAPNGTTTGAMTAAEGEDDATSDRTGWARRHARTGLALGAVLLTALGTVYVMGQRAQTPNEPARSSSVESTKAAVAVASPAEVVTSAPPASVAAPTPERVVQLQVSPANAKVRLKDGTELCDGASCRISAERFDDGELTVTVAAAGYRTRIETLRIEDEQVEIGLSPLPVRVQPRTLATPATPAAPAEPTATAPSGGFGDLPPY